MKKKLQLSSVMLALFVCCGINHVNAQIVEFDVNYCYQIIINNEAFALGIPEGVTTDEACLQQQEIDATDDNQLWKLEVLEADSIYHIVNMASDLAIGVSTWRIAPAEGSAQESPTSPTVNFSWNGSHPGIVQREKDNSNLEQQWIIRNINDTVYNVKANFDLDSAKYWNFWSAGSGVGVGRKNIALFPTVKAEADRIGDPKQFYAYYFVKTDVANPDITSIRKAASNNNIKIYSNNGYIKVKGDLQGKQIEVFSVLGNLISTELFEGGEYNLQIKNGLYIVKIGETVAKVNVR